jgi:signal transduction histidine kinase
MRRQLYLVFKEAVNNAARHSGCSSIALVLRVDGSRLWLEVTDDGAGFDLQDHAEGNGLTSMRRRAARLGAAFDVFSARGAGTTVRLTMTVPEWRPIAAPTQKGR